jgi:hypothetical protein
MLENVQLPEANRPRTPVSQGPPPARALPQAVAPSRTNAKFGSSDRMGAHAGDAPTRH